MTTPASRAERCAVLWAASPRATAKEIAAAYEKEFGEKCSPVTARKARPVGRPAEAGQGPITAAELRAVKEIAAKSGGLSSLTAEVEKVVLVADKVGGLGRLREVLAELNGLLI